MRTYHVCANVNLASHGYSNKTIDFLYETKILINDGTLWKIKKEAVLKALPNSVWGEDVLSTFINEGVTVTSLTIVNP
jgi:ABC-type uncharacterized transport system permease subunit